MIRAAQDLVRQGVVGHSLVARILTGGALAIALGACGELPTDPETGEIRAGLDGGVVTPGGSTCDPGDPGFQDSDPGTDVSWAEVRADVFEKRCGCHTTAGGIGQVVGGLVLSSRDGALAGGHRSAEMAIVPGDPCASILVQKIGDAPPFGGRMPLSGLELTTAQRRMIIDWIAEGAPP